jgi:acyl carrier protein
MDRYTMTVEESAEAFRRVVTMIPSGHVVVATGDLQARLDLWIKRKLGDDPRQAGAFSSAYSRPNLQSAYLAPRNETEQAVVNMWQNVLGIEKVGINDNFFDLGGHSLLATRLVAQLRDTLQVDLPLRRLFETPTVAGLAQAIAELQAEHSDARDEALLEMLSGLSDDEAEMEIKRVTGPGD